jgi:hypothetical protein
MAQHSGTFLFKDFQEQWRIPMSRSSVDPTSAEETWHSTVDVSKSFKTVERPCVFIFSDDPLEERLTLPLFMAAVGWLVDGRLMGVS